MVGGGRYAKDAPGDVGGGEARGGHLQHRRFAQEYLDCVPPRTSPSVTSAINSLSLSLISGSDYYKLLYSTPRGGEYRCCWRCR
jgi:hypothetical protein